MAFVRFALLAFCALFGSASVYGAEPAPGSFTIGMLWPVGAKSDWSTPFIQAMRDLGYREGQNLTVVSRVAKDSNAELPALAAELVALKPDVLVSMFTPPSLALKGATATIPIVAVNIGDPIGTRLVRSLAHPGGNVTATANGVQLWGPKRLEQITEVLPGVRCVLSLRNPTNQSIMQSFPSREDASAKLGLELRSIDVASRDALDRVLAARPDEHCGRALLLNLDILFIARRTDIADYALRNGMALFAPFHEDAEAGALISYGVDNDNQWRRGAAYVDKILKGAKPEDLPVEQPTKFELVINLKTAKALGLTIPQSILALADRVIE
jgi:putative ABC transport system substrate-binding protein